MAFCAAFAEAFATFSTYLGGKSVSRELIDRDVEA